MLGAALLVVGLTSPAAPADAAPESPEAVEQSAGAADDQASAADAPGAEDQPAAEVQQGNGDLPATAAGEGESDQEASAAPADEPAGTESVESAEPADGGAEQPESGASTGQGAEQSTDEQSSEAAPSLVPSTADATGTEADRPEDSAVGAMHTGWCNPTTGSAGSFQQWNSQSGNWTNGNAGKAYSEGDWVQQRVQLSGIAAGNNQFVVSFGFQNGRTIGYDDARLARVADANGTTIPGATGAVSLANATPNPSGGTSEGVATINFTLPSEPVGSIWLYYDVHLASSLDYVDDGLQGAAYFSGSSLHVNQVSLNCNGLGNSALAIPVGHLAYGTITVDKVTDPAGADQLFDFSVTDGQSTSSFQLADTSEPWTSRVGTRSFTISEHDIPASWQLSNLVCTGATATYDLDAAQAIVPIADGSDVTCTFTNTRMASLTVQKSWVEALAGDQTELIIDYGTEQSSATSTANGDAGEWTDTANRATAQVPVGTAVTLSEFLADSNAGRYDQDISCEGVPLDQDDSFVMPDGTVTCTITNDRLVPSLDVIKKGWDAESREIVSGSAVVSGTVITWTYEVTNTGETTVHDIAVVDDQVGSATCPATSLPAGESMTCTASGPVTALP